MDETPAALAHGSYLALRAAGWPADALARLAAALPCPAHHTTAARHPGPRCGLCVPVPGTAHWTCVRALYLRSRWRDGAYRWALDGRAPRYASRRN